MPSVRVEQVRGAPLRHEGREITPVARVARISWRGGQMAWHRPLAVEVREDMREDRRVQRFPIRNATRRAVLSIWLCGCALGALAILTDRVRRRGSNDR